MNLSFNTPITPVKAPQSSHKTTGYLGTPLRVQIPRMSPSPAYFSSRPTRRSRRAATNLCPPSNDRFIPNRARMYAGSSLVKTKLNQDAEPATPQQQEYKRQLRRALFCSEELEPRMLSIGNGDRRSRSLSLPLTEDPCQQDILRANLSTVPMVRKVPRRTIPTIHKFMLQAPRLLQDDLLSLVSSGPMLAVALHYSVYLSYNGKVKKVRNESRGYITSIKWSGNHSFLAFGSNARVEVWDPVREIKAANLFNHAGYVTALDWNGDLDLVAASDTGVQRYDLRIAFPEVGTYDPGEYGISSLKWTQDNMLAISGGNSISLWDARYATKPLLKLQHETVKSVDFCPAQSNVLASGGAGGIKLWNVHTGQIRASISIDDTHVTSVVWSPYRRELMAGYGDKLGVWSVTKNITQLVEWDPDCGRVLSLERGYQNGEVISLHDCEILAGWETFGAAPKPMDLCGNLTGSGLLEMPVIR
jgi:WD40 repeat protein